MPRLAEMFRKQMARVRALVLGPVMLDSGLFDGAAIGRLLDAHESGARDHAQVIWLLLAFEGFLAALASTPVPAAASEAALAI